MAMKFKIKQYQNKFRLRFSEKFYIFRKNFSGIWGAFSEKGHEKMTVMFIPHNEKKIFNFQISKFTVLFFMLLFMVVVVTSSYAVIRNNTIKKQEQRLLMSYEDIRSHLIRFEKMTGSIDDLVDDLKPEIEELYELTAGSEDTSQIWNLEDFDKEDIRELTEKKNIYPEEIFTIKDIQKNLICTTNTIKTVKNFIDVRSKATRVKLWKMV